MKTTSLSILLAVATLSAAAAAQSPTFRMDPAVAVGAGGATASYDLTATPGTVYAVLADVFGGPIDVLGERVYLGLSPAVVTLRAGVIPATGIAGGTLALPPIAGIAGTVVYGQSAVIDFSAPNRLFTVTNAESSVPYAASGAVVVDFADPVGSGFTGSYSTHVAGHIAGGAVTFRTHRTVDPQGIVFPQPLENPLNPNGCREQMVFRAQDLGATGQGEMVTGIHWYSATPILADRYGQIELGLGHTPITPDYSIDPFTLLPLFPNSGLNDRFSLNGTTQPVYMGQYVLAPASQRPDGFVPLPGLTPFAYDGVSSLLLEFKTWPDPQALGVNGLYGRMMSTTYWLPAARCYKGGTTSVQLDPTLAYQGRIDNWMADLEFEFARVQTDALSPWLDSGAALPDYDAPILATSLPAGTSVQVEYRGAPMPAAVYAGPWGATPNSADGRRYLQLRMTFTANVATREVPVVDSVVVPFN